MRIQDTGKDGNVDMRNRLIEQVVEKMQYLKEQDLEYLKNVLVSVLNDYDVQQIKNEIVEYDTDSNYRLLGTFLVAKKVEGCTDRTIRYYKETITAFLDKVNTPIVNITADNIRYYIANRSVRDKVSKTTQDNELRNLRSFFGWLTAEEYITRNPTLKIKAIKKEKRIKKPYTEIEIEKLRGACKNKRDLAIIDVMYSTGCRVAEVVDMDIDDINGDEVTVFGKGEKERVTYLNARALNSLKEYMDERTDDNRALFVSLYRPHERLQISGIEVLLRKLGRSVGISKSHPHKMRRTTATIALERGMPIEEVQKMLGHEQISTTTIYAQSSKESVKYDHKKYVV